MIQSAATSADLDGGLEREAQRIGDLDPVLGEGGRQRVDDPLDRGLVLGVQLGDEVFGCDHGWLIARLLTAKNMYAAIIKFLCGIADA